MSETPMIDSFVKDSKLEDGDYLNLYLQAQRIEEQLNETKAFLIEAVEWIQEIKGYVPNAKQADKFYTTRLDEWLERVK